MVISFSEERRRLAVKEISIEYIENKRRAEKYYEEYLEGCWRGLFFHFYSDSYYKYKEYEEKCSELDISLGLLVKEGDYESIPEYRDAIHIG